MKKLLLITMLLLMPISTNAKTIDMGDFLITAYCPCYECSEGHGRKTSTGKYARSEHTIAVDPDVINYGSKVLIGETTYVAEDCGGCINGDHIDNYFNGEYMDE